MDVEHSCNPLHRFNGSYYCRVCNSYSCEKCILDLHTDHISQVVSVSETVLETLNHYIKLKSKSSKALSIHNESNTASSISLNEVLSRNLSLLSANFSTVYSQISKKRKEDIEKVRTARKIALLRENLATYIASAKFQYSNLTSHPPIEEIWANPVGEKAVALLMRFKSTLERKKIEASQLNAKFLSWAAELKKLKSQQLYKIWVNTTLKSHGDSLLCKLDYPSEYEAKMYKAYYGTHEMAVYHCIGKRFLLSIYGEYSFPHNFGILNLGEKIYIVGGQKKNGNFAERFLNTTTELNPVDMTCVEKQQMKERRMCLGVTGLVGKYIVAIGGYNLNSLLATCEVYSIKDNKWTYIPSLNSPKSNTGVCTFQERKIYAFAGYIERRDNGDIEMIDALDMEAHTKWAIILLAVPGPWESRQNPGAKQISNVEMLIFGGVHRGLRLKKCVRFFPSGNAMKEDSLLKAEDIFLDCYSRIIHGQLHTFGCRQQSIQTYCAKKKEWSSGAFFLH